MAARRKRQKKYYFPRRLREQLAQILHYPVTLVEAPSGFGKTTAVREYLKNNLPEDTRQHWYTCLGEPRPAAWRNICRLLAQANPETADRLQKIKMPTMDTLMYAADILKDFSCVQKTCLVIDNYQLLDCDVPRELISVLSMHGNPNLHLVVITQNIGARPRITFHNADIHLVDGSYFFFDKKSTARVFRLEGIRLVGEKLDKVYAGTEGWIAAIRLQIIGYKETGSLDDTADIIQLVETAIWNRLTSEEKEFLVSVSVLGSFTARQAAFLVGKETLPAPIKELLRGNDFIRFFPREHIYTVHSILLDYLRNRFYHHQPESFQHRILRRAGRCHAAEGQLFKAARYFYRIGDFEALLALPFDSAYLADQREEDMFTFIGTVLAECPPEILSQYPFVLLLFSYIMLLDGNDEAFRQGCRLVDSCLVENRAALAEGELRKLRGEFLLLKSLATPNNPGKMNAGAVEAYQALNGPSGLIATDMPWTFGNISILSLFWNKPGELGKKLLELESALPPYRRVTRGHGSGADSALRAEVLLMRGEAEQAEILCHKALYEARSRRQICIGLCAELTLARIAILRGDGEGYLTATGNIRNYAQENPRLYVLRMVDLCHSFLAVELGQAEKLAQWLYDMESIKKTLYAPSVPFARVIYAYLLFKEKRYTELYGFSESLLNRADYKNHLLPRVYHLMFLAMAKYETGNKEEATGYLVRALELALPDGILLPFARPGGKLKDLLPLARDPFWEERGADPDFLLKLCERQAGGVEAVKKVLRSRSPLTPREREVALLARKRLSRKEIAEKLYISELTVKTYLQNIYGKLGVHSRAELGKVEF